MPDPSVTRFSTLERFVKSKTDLRIRRSGLEYLLEELDCLVESIVKHAEKHAQTNDRSTILLEDFEQGVDDALQRGSISVESLLNTIENLPVVDIVHLANQVKVRAEEIRAGSQ